ncbi:unnamed protein product [Kuraishia capsulata CBS 1993]|uniref:DNA polymerase eta n=1 Tax=Kuraishia capsulata CBS 1993 TaxID=1382522 RepID=W6MH49_9ASCO|nr:uncharacterized protein KUCA_T00000935001 [Kuraishia capsulata CBS 1993]CDK24968.1 unnamed protein product [Kuraishia capsulata CBS 1993]
MQASEEVQEAAILSPVPPAAADGSSVPNTLKPAIVRFDATSGSKFTWKNLLDLSRVSSSYSSPLAVIAHVDVNAFFAQAEQIRLGLSPEDPVVCVQWTSLIAVSYAARKYGIGRMDTLASAKQKCPNLIPAHTAVFKKGELNWSYVDGLPSAAEHKVSLDPYRRESRKMMRIFRSFCDHVEKASVDESFLDLGRLVFSRMLELFPALRVCETEEVELNGRLPDLPETMPEEIALWKGFVVDSNTDDEPGSPLIRDWDDVVSLIGSHLADQIRHRIHDELGYFTSCGIGRVKTVAKLASGFKKPDNQTIVRNSAIPIFFKDFRLTDFWGMGGKTGEYIEQRLNVPQEDSIEFIRRLFSLEELTDKLPEQGEKVYQLVRGEFATPLTLRTDIKAMGTSKNFRGESVTSVKGLYDWFKVYAADLAHRLNDLDEEDGILNANRSNRSVRRPKTITVHFYQKNGAKSRQCPFPQLPSIGKIRELIYINGCKLLEQLEENWNETIDGPMFPCLNCSLGLSSFSNIMVTKSIDEFMSKGTLEEAFPAKSEIVIPDQSVASSVTPPRTPILESGGWYCEKCKKEFPESMEAEHRDWHVASDMAQEILEQEGRRQLSYAEMLLEKRHNQKAQNRSVSPVPRITKKPTKKTKTNKKVFDANQSTLPFS